MLDVVIGYFKQKIAQIQVVLKVFELGNKKIMNKIETFEYF